MKRTELSPYRIYWCILDTMNGKSLYKYQIEALKKLGFTICMRNCEACKHYRDKESAIADAENIRKAYEIVSMKNSDAAGALITDKQYSLCNIRESSITKATIKQRALFQRLIDNK